MRNFSTSRCFRYWWLNNRYHLCHHRTVYHQYNAQPYPIFTLLSANFHNISDREKQYQYSPIYILNIRQSCRMAFCQLWEGIYRPGWGVDGELWCPRHASWEWGRGVALIRVLTSAEKSLSDSFPSLQAGPQLTYWDSRSSGIWRIVFDAFEIRNNND